MVRLLHAALWPRAGLSDGQRPEVRRDRLNRTPTLPEAVLVAVGFSAAVGAFFGHARHTAASLNAIEAVRYE